jgi:hypothetical protein
MQLYLHSFIKPYALKIKVLLHDAISATTTGERALMGHMITVKNNITLTNVGPYTKSRYTNTAEK